MKIRTPSVSNLLLLGILLFGLKSAKLTTLLGDSDSLPNVVLAEPEQTDLKILFPLFQDPKFTISQSESEWILMESGTTNPLYGVWGSSGNNAFAVGENGIILHYDGNNWTTMPSGTTETLYAIWGTGPNDVFAVGKNGTILHHDGINWSAMNSGVTGPLNDVWGSSNVDVFAVGGSDYNFFSTILHYDGGGWREIETGYFYEGVWGSTGNDVIVLGNYVTPAERWEVIQHYDGSDWDTMSSDNADYLYDLWGSGPADVFAVGIEADQIYSGAILHYDGNFWSIMKTGIEASLYGVWGSDSNNVFAVGGAGIIQYYDGSVWSNIDSGTSNTLRAIWGSGPNNIFAVGAKGTILHYSGEHYTISGNVRDASGNPISNVTVLASTGVSSTTDVNGAYTISNLVSGTYSITPTKSSWVFSPPTRTVSVSSDVNGQNFTILHTPISTTIPYLETESVLTTLDFTNTQGLTTTITFPAGTVNITTTIVLTPTIAQHGGDLVFAGHAFVLEAYQGGAHQPEFTFEEPVTVTIYYSGQDIRLVSDESLLTLRWWDGSIWLDAIGSCNPQSSYVRNIEENFVSIPICHSSMLGLFGPTNRVYLPLVLHSN